STTLEDLNDETQILERIAVTIPEWYTETGKLQTILRRFDVLQLSEFIAIVLSNRFPSLADVLEDLADKFEKGD
ncbi:unnamed protein product, partial [Amoebophrya sp. A25]